MAMAQRQKEVIHLSFGAFANHISTHYWNAQESYLDYSPSSSKRDEPRIDADASFRAGQGAQGQETYCPRALLFDLSGEYGNMRRLNPLYDAFALDQEDEEDDDAQEALMHAGNDTWGRPAQIQRTAPRIGKSAYQRRLERVDAGEDISDSDEDEDQDEEQDHPDSHVQSGNDPQASGQSESITKRRAQSTETGRYWSDHARLFYHPRSLVPIGGQLIAPMAGASSSSAVNDDGAQENDGRARFESWEMGHALFKEVEREHSTLDENLRWFAEESDLLQAFQVISNTSDAFGGYASAYVEALADEHPKTPIIIYGAAWGDAEGDDRLSRLRAMNNALSLAFMPDHASLYVPLASPVQSWDVQNARWAQHVRRARVSSMYETSAILGAHIESATLGMRLRTRPESASSLMSRLNWRRDTKIAHLGGCLPTPLLAPLSSGRSGPIDPIDALLASRGYGARERPRDGPPEDTPEIRAQKAAMSLGEAWHDFSEAPRGKSQSKTGQGRAGAGAGAGAGRKKTPFAQSVVARDADVGAEMPTQQAVEVWGGLQEPLGFSTFAPLAYPVPSSHPQFFNGLTSTGRALPDDLDKSTRSKVGSLPLLSSLRTTPSTSTLLRSTRSLLSAALSGHAPLSAYGLGSSSSSAAGAAANDVSEGAVGGRDGLREIRERLEDCLSAYMVGYGEGSGEEEEDDGRGTDEEWDEEGEEWDLGSDME